MTVTSKQRDNKRWADVADIEEGSPDPIEEGSPEEGYPIEVGSPEYEAMRSSTVNYEKCQRRLDSGQDELPFQNSPQRDRNGRRGGKHRAAETTGVMRLLKVKNTSIEVDEEASQKKEKRSQSAPPSSPTKRPQEGCADALEAEDDASTVDSIEDCEAQAMSLDATEPRLLEEASAEDNILAVAFSESKAPARQQRPEHSGDRAFPVEEEVANPVATTMLAPEQTSPSLPVIEPLSEGSWYNVVARIQITNQKEKLTAPKASKARNYSIYEAFYEAIAPKVFLKQVPEGFEARVKESGYYSHEFGADGKREWVKGFRADGLTQMSWHHPMTGSEFKSWVDNCDLDKFQGPITHPLMLHKLSLEAQRRWTNEHSCVVSALVLSLQ